MPKFFISVAEFGLQGTSQTKWSIRRTHTITIATTDLATAKDVDVYFIRGWIQGRDHEDAKQEDETETERNVDVGRICVDAFFAAVWFHGQN